MDEQTQEKINNMQLLEHRLQNALMQKQNINSQLLEIENALKELETNSKEVFKIVANIMVATDREELIKDLKSKKDIFGIKIKTLEKQETKLKEESQSLQQEIMSQMKDESE